MLCLTLFIGQSMAGALERVPTDHATIQDALNAVDSGGTVLIDASGTYVEDLIIEKPGIKLIAAAGVTPTIRYAGVNPHIIRADFACQVGSNTGGRIIIDGDAGGSGSQSRVFQAQHTSGEVRFENMDLRNLRNNAVIRPLVNTADVTLSNLDIDGGGIVQFPVRVDNLNSVLTLNCVNMYNIGRDCVYSAALATGTLNVYNSTFKTLFDCFFIDTFAGGITINVEDSFLHNTGPAGAFQGFYTRGPLTVNMRNSVVKADDPDSIGFYHFNDLAGTGPVVATFDHCDFVADFPFRLLTSFDANTFTVTNCNFRYGAQPAGRGQLLGGPDLDDTFVWDHNNVLSGVYGTFPVGANDIAVNPTYANASGGDFTVGDPTVATSSSTGGAIGSNQSYPTGTCSSDLILYVPDDYATIQAAIDAVAPYGTIRITDSGVYEEALLVDTPGIVIEAAPCESPTLLYDGSVGHMIRCSVPFQFGSNSGGRILLDANLGGPGSLSRVLDTRHTNGTVVFENLGLDNLRNTYIFFPNPIPNISDVYFNNVHADGHDPGLNLAVVAFPFRFDGYNGTVTFNWCNIRRMARDAFFFFASGNGTVNVLNSIVEAGFDTIFFDFAVGGFTMNVDNSYINETGGGGAFSTIYTRGPNTFNFTNSVIRCADFDGFGVYMFDDQAGAGPTTLTMDHCDVVADFPFRLLSSFNINEVTVTNTNFRYGAQSSGRGQLLGGDNGDDTIVWDYNNVVSGSYDQFPVGANDISIDPGYTSFANGDFTYSDATVLISDASGEPLGSTANFVPSVLVPTISLDYTEGTGYEVDVVVPDFLPQAQPKSQPVQVQSQTVGNVLVTSLAIGGPNAGDYSVLAVPPVIVNKSCPVSIKVQFDPMVGVPTAGLTADLTLGTNDAANPSLIVTLEGDAVGDIPGASNESWELYE